MNVLEAKLALLIQSCGRLREENHRFRQELAHALSDNRLCNDQLNRANERLASAKARLAILLTTLPEDLP